MGIFAHASHNLQMSKPCKTHAWSPTSNATKLVSDYTDGKNRKPGLAYDLFVHGPHLTQIWPEKSLRYLQNPSGVLKLLLVR